AEAATAGDWGAVLRSDLFQMRANGANVGRMHQRVKAAADKFIGTITQDGLECGIRELYCAVCGENGDDFPGGVQQRRKLCSPERETGVRNNSLCHLIVASLAGWSTELPARLAEASKDRPRTRNRYLKVKRLYLL